MNAYNSIILVGAGSISHGCGILVTFAGKKFVTTTQHIVNQLEKEPDLPWVQFHLRKTKYPINGAQRLQINDIIKSDDHNDLALCFTDPIPGGQYLEIDGRIPAPGCQVKAFGYPIIYAAEQLALNLEDPLLPFQMEGTIIDHVPQLTLRNPYDGTLVEVSDIIVAKMDNGRGFSGYSGGLIVNAEYNTPLGLIIGENGNHIIFSSFSKITAILKPYNQRSPLG
jgi:hypothetical protein